MALTKIGKEGITGISNSADANAITIDSSENVAIGSSDPQGFQLQVNPGVAGNIARFTDGVNANTVIKTSGSTTTFGPDTTNSLVLQTNSVERVNINTSGLAQFKSSGISAGNQVFQVIDDGATIFQIRAEDGNISFPQSGAGIYLGVTAGDAAHLLDHYETGSWTPTLSSTSATFSYSFNGGHYVRVGDMVTCLARIQMSGTPGGTTGNALFIAGLPFTIYNQSDLYSGDSLGHFISFNIPSGYTNSTIQYQQNSTTVLLNFTGDTVGESTAAASAVSSSTQFRFRLTYRTA
jgi:hypothetical protein